MFESGFPFFAPRNRYGVPVSRGSASSTSSAASSAAPYAADSLPALRRDVPAPPLHVDLGPHALIASLVRRPSG
jgi:hypothetical protein